eukprot:Blabericola_migrator_1__10561@NODE_5_length_29060_cov_171_088642_g4_i0_p4_GENE_NODE_5_length_29060_cov_171_088642_g4_i0NODE_5_length_29060_cov_171_088642_g4_i0_p4_ORF_typecomplete_len592_score101_23PGM_PMM_I/PF02878_16/2e41PGM_PMM_II/PF02879_16/5_7e03PGM_PMM_II/PF02879_16/2e20PGM_PMM_III/PF02880_16/1_2e20PGM_PMM_IV/PF00408_20/2_3e08_NODE_5_length_29060_cov_171_088642_g4_i01934521120
MTTVEDQVAAYLAWETQPIFLEEYQHNKHDLSFIKSRFSKHLKFGTAGLRSVMGCGWNAMNTVTVQQATQGVCQYYLDTLGEAAKAKCVIVGCDARHNSRWFAHVVTAVFISKGFHVKLFSNYTPTPLNPFLVRKYNALCGIQLTASHNPAKDNGYKLYHGNGVQIIPPMDADIHRRLVKFDKSWPGVSELLNQEAGQLRLPHPLVDDPLAEAWEAYKVDLAQDLGLLKTDLSGSDLKIVYTAMHGVGHDYAKDFLLTVLQLPESCFLAVPKQKDPDPDFPSLSYPNPEEAGALDLAKEYADSVEAGLIVANDPDADRFAAVEKVDDVWRSFTGDELGAIFALIMFERAIAAGVPADQLLMVNSAVSSRFMSRLCDVEGSTYIETLTGFKWVMNVVLDAEESLGLKLVLGYEEALGYGLSSRVPDKDGLTASAIFVEKACQLHELGSSMSQYLQEGMMKYGFFATHNSYYRCAEPAAQAAVLEQFRNGGSYPSEIAGYKISRIRDLKPCYDSASETKKCSLPRVNDDMMTIFLENGAHVTLRGSGTEPKFKFYSEMYHQSSSEEAKKELVECVDKVLNALFAGNEKYFSKP